MQTAAPSFWPDALPAVTVAAGSSRPRIGRSPASRPPWTSGRMCSSRSTTTSAPAPRTVDRDDLLGKDRPRPQRPRPVVAADGELVLLRARDRVLRAQVLGRLQHPAGHREARAAGGDPAPRQGVVQQHPVPALAPQRIAVE
jgi:hypothetical protein